MFVAIRHAGHDGEGRMWRALSLRVLGAKERTVPRYWCRCANPRKDVPWSATVHVKYEGIIREELGAIREEHHTQRHCPFIEVVTAVLEGCGVWKATAEWATTCRRFGAPCLTPRRTSRAVPPFPGF